MIYLVLDTNVWFYLANGFNTTNNQFDDGLHFKIVSTLKNFVDSEQITILTNQIIIDEWERNKVVANRLIEKHRNTVTANKGQMKNIKKYIDEDDRVRLNEIIRKYEEKMEQVISDNETHISEVEELLMKKTQKVEIEKEIKVVAADRAINKLAPFKGDKSNSMADAVILLSSVEYIKEKSKLPVWDEDEDFYVFPKSTFITINKGDFANPRNEKEVHPELKSIFDSIEMKFESNIGTVINQVQADLIELEEIEQIEREMDAEYWRSVVYCEVCNPDPEKMYVNNIIEFGESIQIDNEMIDERNLNQLKLFEIEAIDKEKEKERTKRSDIDSVQLGTCTYCSSEYLKCQYCGTVNHYGDYLEDNRLECEGCGIIYQINYYYIGSGMQEVEIKIVGDEFNEEEQ